MSKKSVTVISVLAFIFGGAVGALCLMKYTDHLKYESWQAEKSASALFPAGMVGEAIGTLEDLRAGDTNGARMKLEWQLKFFLDLLEKSTAQKAHSGDRRLVEGRNLARDYLAAHPPMSNSQSRRQSTK